MKNFSLQQESPEEFWKDHLRRHNSTNNISNQLFNECVNQNVLFMTNKYGQFSSLENLSSKIYKEQKDNQYYVKKKRTSASDLMRKCGLEFHTQRRQKSTLPNLDESDKPKIFQTHQKSIDDIVSVDGKLGDECRKTKTDKKFNKIIKSFSLKRKESSNVVYLEVFY